jgi:hypothetical protein
MAQATQSREEIEHCDSDSHASRDQLDKAIQTLQARAALRGFALHILSNGKSGAEFLVCRWNLSRSLPSIQAVESFLTQAGVPHA